MEVKFSYHENNYIIQCNILDKMEAIIDKFKSKIKSDEVFFMYNGKKINRIIFKKSNR